VSRSMQRGSASCPDRSGAVKPTAPLLETRGSVLCLWTCAGGADPRRCSGLDATRGARLESVSRGRRRARGGAETRARGHGERVGG
jgi:hypothetical protein